MTTTTPPGWYPEPGHTGNGPALERWWDGNTWTEYTRTAPVPAGVPANGQQPFGGQPSYPPYPSGDVIGSPGGGPRRPRTVAIAIVVALVVIGGIVAAVVAVGNNGDDSADKKSSPSVTLPGRSGQPQNPQNPQSQNPDDPSNPGGPAGPSDGPAVDIVDGISLPLLDGWTGGTAQDGSASISTGSYTCPNDTSGDQECSLGGAYSEPAKALKLTATTAEGVAKEDIKGNASSSYGASTYGATTSHQEVESKAVTVAGQKGYLVRWKVSTKSGTDGYVESLAFPSPSVSNQIVVVRFGFDISGKAPKPAVIDQITQGIKADSTGGSSGSGSGGTGV
ncbi:Protein of unknown function [Actinacidiphila yanglinensis]|uniref:DUF2510 domain-containing protein n=1 Tax=Actinacidiphila yanglinensis TaxID=310779 RepID=A0A1H6AZG9_9ACTN|nr:DUF2510 domain-containing protein [Actinacidiphila yanglinensis]SEG53784.1 Protein of unknown function [Actinacidiphila yanglinensis]